MKNQILLYSNTRKSSDIFYFAGVSMHDDFYCFSLDEKKCALVSPLEIGRVRRKSKLDAIFDYSEVCSQMPKKIPRNYFEAVVFILKRHKVRSLIVPEDFPVGVFADLVERGFKVDICQGDFFAERKVKSKCELSEIQKANDVASVCFQMVEETLHKSEIRGDVLYYNGEILTSEYLRSEIEKLAISLGADALDTVAACGNQACDPHEVGYGTIKPHSLIVFDIFPRLRESGYFGDMTRTFLKGEPSEKQIALVECVKKAQEIAISKICMGRNGADVHNYVADFFEKNNYKTKSIKGFWSGFFHSTGHGLGLDVHESPSLSVRNCILECGNVVTVEPGLYYRGIGGCRIEDNVVVTRNGCKLLSKYHYNWIID